MNPKIIVQYYCAIPDMLRLLRQEQREIALVYDTLRGAGDGLPGGGAPGKPVENAAAQADEQGAWERLRDIEERIRVLNEDKNAIAGCLDALHSRYKSVLKLRYRYRYSWAKISVQMGTPDSTVRSWHDRALFVLGEAVEELPQHGELCRRASRART